MTTGNKEDECEALTGSIHSGTSYELCFANVKRDWFSFADTFVRLGLNFGAYYFYVITQPFTFCSFWWQYSFVWWPSRAKALTHACTFPIVPFVTLFGNVWAAVKNIGKPQNKDLRWRVWFENPPGFWPGVFYTTSARLGKILSLFMFCGRDPDALYCSSSYLPTFLNKDFWRALMESGGCRVPHELGRWDGTKLEMYKPIKDTDVVFKVTRGCWGEGDQFLINGKDFKTVDDLQRLINETEYTNNVGQIVKGYKSCDLLLLEYCRPKEDLGVHAIDILTMVTPEGPRVLNCVYWGECTGPSSHSTTAGYTIDVDKEELVAPGPQIGPYFAAHVSTKLIGLKIPGVRKACETVCKAHANSPYAWMTVVGWDCMIMRNGEAVFFEGNFGATRIPRRVFMTPSTLSCFLRSYAWPFTSWQPRVLPSSSILDVNLIPEASRRQSPAPSPPGSRRPSVA